MGKGDLNVYAYVRGQSYRAVDPTGPDGVDLFNDDSGLRAAHHTITKKATSGAGPTASKAESWVGGQSSVGANDVTEKVEGSRYRSDTVSVMKNHFARAAFHMAAGPIDPTGALGPALLSVAPKFGLPSDSQIADKLSPVSATAGPEARMAGGFAAAGVAVAAAIAVPKAISGIAEYALGGEAGSMVHGGGVVLRHYTDEAGFNGIVNSGMISASGSSRQVFATELVAGPQVAHEKLFLALESHAGRGDYVIEFVPKQGVSFAVGKEGELYHMGSLRFGRQVDLKFAGKNPY